MAGLTLRSSGGALELTGSSATLRLGHNGGSTSLGKFLGVGPQGPQGLPGAAAAKGDKGDPGAPGGSDAALAGWANDDASAFRAALTRSGKKPAGRDTLVFDVKDYGAVGNGTTDDTAAIVAAKNAAESATAFGAGLYFGPGNFVVTSAVSVAKPMTIRGASSSSTSIISRAGASGVFTISADRVIVSDIYFQCQGTISAVTTSQVVALQWTSGNLGVVERCYFAGWYISIDFQSCGSWIVNDNYLSRAVRYNLKVRNLALPDSGDQVVCGNYFAVGGTYATAAHIRQESAGGMKIVGNKILQGALGIDLAVADGVATSILNVVANSFEYQTVSAVKVGLNGPSNTGSFIKILVASNQITGNSCSSPVLNIGGTAAGISSVRIADNIMSGTALSTVFIGVQNVDDISIDGNQGLSGATGISIASSVTNVFVGPTNKFQNVVTSVSNASPSPVATNVWSGLIVTPPAGYTNSIVFVNDNTGVARFTMQASNGAALFAGGLRIGGSYQNTSTLLITPTSGFPAAVFRSAGSGTADLLQLTDSVGTSIRGRIDQYGRYVADGAGSPTIAAGAAAGTGPTVTVSNGSSDMAGTITVVVGTSPASGALCVVSFHDAYASPPRAVQLEPMNSVTAALSTTKYIGAKSATSWQINLASVPTAAATLSWAYQVIG